MAIHLLEKNRPGAEKIANLLQETLEKIGNCQQCRTLTETTLCRICSDERRDRNQLCIVETPADLIAIEQAGAYRGLYFVLMGHLSPIDGIGPEEIGIDKLTERLHEENIEEMILATNTTVEGEATAFYIMNKAQALGIKVSRIAHGVPLGGELEYVDGGSLSLAFNNRTSYTQ